MTGKMVSSPSVIHVTERGKRSLKTASKCVIGSNIAFSTESLESYFFTQWEPAAYDLLLLTAAVEFADRIIKRPEHTWERCIELRVPVHDVDRWRTRRVSEALHDTLSFVTGDRWNIAFYERHRAELAPRQGTLDIAPGVEAVIPFSNGLDSRAVAALAARELDDRLVRIRLGSAVQDGEAHGGRHAFTAVPYKVKTRPLRSLESSARSRGFKFAVISGVAAYLSKAARIIVPESGQGALGPSLVPVGQAYEDYRSHPLFTLKVERLFEALLGYRVRYEFPQIWFTKGETLRRFVQECDDRGWASTWSCWRQSRHVSVDGKKRQCGVCAACMLRRMSVHAAGLTEPAERFVWTNLAARSFEAGAQRSYRAHGKITRTSREYAIAGALHLDHLAELKESRTHNAALNLAAFQLAGAVASTEAEVRVRLDRLLEQHSKEWKMFLLSLGADSFVADWALRGRK